MRSHDTQLANRAKRPASVHMPSMTDNDGFAGQCVGLERGQQEGNLRNIVHHREFLIDRLAEHHLLDDPLFGDAEFLGLLWDLLLDEWRQDEAWANDIGAHIVLGSFLGHCPCETKNT